MSSPCITNVTSSGQLNDAEAERLLKRLHDKAKLRSQKTGATITDALKEIAGEMVVEEKMMSAIQKRNALLFIQAKRNAKAYAKRFSSLGEGLQALIEGSNKTVPGA